MMTLSAVRAPKITVLMPAYNAGEYVRPAINSILTQTFSDFELLIMDDGSTDGSLETIDTGQDNRIRLVRHSTNCGLIATLNHGVTLARGEYLARMDADDLCEPTRLERQVRYLENHPEVGVCSTWAVFIDSEGRETGTLRTATGNCLQRLFWKPSPLIHAAMMVRTNLLRAYLYDPVFKDAEDYELFLRLYDVTQIHNLPEKLYRIRSHNGSISKVQRESQLESSYRAFCRFIGHNKISYEIFLALSFVDFSMNPFYRFWVSLQVSKRTGVSISCLVRDNWNYFRKHY